MQTPSPLEILTALQMLGSHPAEQPPVTATLTEQYDPVDRSMLSDFLRPPQAGVSRASVVPHQFKQQKRSAPTPASLMNNGMMQSPPPQMQPAQGNYPEMPGYDTLRVWHNTVNTADPDAPKMQGGALWAVPTGMDMAHVDPYELPPATPLSPSTFGFGANDRLSYDPALVASVLPLPPAAPPKDTRKPIKLDQYSDIYRPKPAANSNNNQISIITPNPAGTSAGSGTASPAPTSNSYKHSASKDDYWNLTAAPAINSASYNQVARGLNLPMPSGGIPALQNQQASGDPATIRNAAIADSTEHARQVKANYYNQHIAPLTSSLDAPLKQVGGGYFPNGVLGEFYNRFVAGMNPNLNGDTTEWIKRARQGVQTGDSYWMGQMQLANQFFDQSRAKLDQAARGGVFAPLGKDAKIRQDQLDALIEQARHAITGQ